MDTETLADRLHRYELALARRDPGGIDGGLTALLDADFTEVGRSGRTWTRASMASLLEADAHGDAGRDAATLTLEDVAVTLLAEDVALVTYRTPGTARASIWVRRTDGWRLRYHQGTPTSDAAP